MLAWISALAFALATYLRLKPLNSEDREEEIAKKKALKKAKLEERASKGNAITLRSLKVLGISPVKLYMQSWISAFVVGIAWLFIVQNYFAGIIMGLVGYQLPGLWVEKRASRYLDAMGNQVGLFVSTVADMLQGGKTLADSQQTACLLMREAPMEPIAKTYLQEIAGEVPIIQATENMATSVDMGNFYFYADIIAAIKVAGGTGGRGLQILDYELQEEEEIQADLKGEISVWMGLLLFFLSITLAGPFVYRLGLPDIWREIPSHMSWIPIASACCTLITFTGLRRLSRYRVSI